jgi:DnaK suppressor protein
MAAWCHGRRDVALTAARHATTDRQPSAACATWEYGSSLDFVLPGPTGKLPLFGTGGNAGMATGWSGRISIETLVGRRRKVHGPKRASTVNEPDVTAQKARPVEPRAPAKGKGARRHAMTDKELEAFRTIFKNRQAELEDRNRSRGTLAIEASPDELDRIQHSQEREFAIGNLDRNSTLREFRDALSRLAARKFGICVDCEETINPKRLAAIPGHPHALFARRSGS